MTHRAYILLLSVALLAPIARAADHAADHAAEHAAVRGRTADESLAALKKGNARFTSGKSAHPNGSAERRKKIAASQHPKAVVLGCADSRVPPELVFDEGLGDLFVVRVAGNVADPVNVGSVEYAAEHLGVPLVVVLGHHDCGAVKATAEADGKAEGNIGAIVSEIAPSVEQARAAPAKEGLVNDAVHANARRTAAALTERSPLLKRLLEERKLRIVVAVYDLASGKVEFE